MFGNTSNERRLPAGQKPASPGGREVSPAGLVAQESSWIGLLSVVSRPALSFLHRYVTGRARSSAPSEREAGWIGAEGPTSFDEHGDFMRRLSDMVPARPLPLVPEQRPGGPAPWLSAESLQDLGVEGPDELLLSRNGHFSSLRTFLSHVVWSSSQETRPTAGSRARWAGLWPADGSQSGLLSELSWAQDVTAAFCPPQAAAETKGGETTTVFVQSSDGDSVPGENTGAAHHKAQLANNGLHTVQNTSPGLGAACCELVLVGPDQDNGYSSLEEEHVLMGHVYVTTASGQQPLPQVEEDDSEDASSGGMEEEAASSPEDQSGPPTPQCQNKAIAYIMGCPCSDEDSSSQSGGESTDDDDDGFDSEGSSDLSDVSDEDDDEDSESEAESEAEHLWRSLSQNLDPYSPRNFRASLHTGSTPPRTVPPSPPASTQSTPASSPPCASDTWDDSTSASEVDEAETLHLWSSFSCSSDPYSPFNFQAPLSTQGPSEASRAKGESTQAPQPVLHSPPHKAACPPQYSKEAAEDRLDSGFSEHCSNSSSSQSGAPNKKVGLPHRPVRTRTKTSPGL